MNYMWKCTFHTAAFVGVTYCIVHKHQDMDNIEIAKINQRLSTPAVVIQDIVHFEWQQLAYRSHVQYTWAYKHPHYLSRNQHT
jgi:hypothetical protein